MDYKALLSLTNYYDKYYNIIKKVDCKSQKCERSFSVKNRIFSIGMLTALCILGFMLKMPAKSYAFSVVPVEVKMYSTSATPVYAAPDIYSNIVLYLERFTNLTVTGITENGFYRVNLNGDYYIPGPYLVSQLSAEKTDKQRALENLSTLTEAYCTQLEQMENYSSSFALLDITGDGIPEIFDLSGKEIYTYYNDRAVMLYYNANPVTFYYNKDSNILLGYYTWNGNESWEIYYKDTSLLPWGQFRCISTDASLYKGKAVAISHSYTNTAETRAELYNILKNILAL